MAGHLSKPQHTLPVVPPLLLTTSSPALVEAFLHYATTNSETSQQNCMLTEVCNDVQVEPELQVITSEELSGRSANAASGARLDVAVSGLWGGRREINICGR